MSGNPWLDIPLADYEGHMSLPQIGQAELLAGLFDSMLKTYLPESVAILGCAGGNGFDRIDPIVTRRVVGIDVNPTYVATAAERWRHRLPGLQLIAADLSTETVTFEPVSLMYAALLFEYVDPASVLQRLPALLQRDGLLCTVVQLPTPSIPDITPSPFTSLRRLSTIMRLVSPHELQPRAVEVGLRSVQHQVFNLPSGKRFQLQVFRARNT